jgi:tungstate transport system substrate-binding protein
MPFSMQAQNERFRISTTTSVENSGLLDVLLPAFEAETNVRTDVIAVGTGKALKLGEDGDVDMVLVHSPKDEEIFIQKGFGIDRRPLMKNDFIILGDKSDPAGIKKAKTAAEAFYMISEKSSSFISRGDESGTHKMEKKIWSKAGITPNGKWYKEVGQGMGAVLIMANDNRSYTISDRGTYLSMKSKIDLDILFSGDSTLFNYYSVIAVNPKRHPHVNHATSVKFIDFLTGLKGQKIISEMKIDGQPLFIPVMSAEF